MNNLTKIAALPTGGGCQSALRSEDRGARFATGGPVSPGAVILDRKDGPESHAPRGAPQPLVPIVAALARRARNERLAALAAATPVWQNDRLVWPELCRADLKGGGA